MSQSTLVATLEEIQSILEKAGHRDKALWLGERRDLLCDPQTTDDAREHVLSELHKIVPGMGGLLDLPINPSPDSGFDARDVRARLDVLGEQLYRLTGA